MHIVRFCKCTKTISICKLFYKRTYHLDFYCSFSYQSTHRADTIAKRLCQNVTTCILAQFS